MNKFSEKSEKELSTCHPELQRLFRKVNEIIPCSILEGHRNEERQNLLFTQRKTKLKFPNGNHNKLPSAALDAAPNPIDFTNQAKAIARFYYFAGIVKAVAAQLGIKIRSGCDWDGDMMFDDQTFDDLGHFELAD